MAKIKVRPIKPGEVVKAKKETVFPDAVLQAFNELITLHFNGNHATIKQDDVIALIMAKMGFETKDRGKIFDNGWLDVEDVYRAEGWHVEYDKPGYNETYPSTFIFKRK